MVLVSCDPLTGKQVYKASEVYPHLGAPNYAKCHRVVFHTVGEINTGSRERERFRSGRKGRVRMRRGKERRMRGGGRWLYLTNTLTSHRKPNSARR